MKRTVARAALGCLPLLLACGGPAAPAESGEPSTTANDAPASDGDESSDPGLEDPAQRQATIERLTAEYADAAKQGNKEAPALAFIRRHGAALTRVYVDGRNELDPKARLGLLNLLVSFDDPVTAPALALAIAHYAKTGDDVDDAIAACQAAKRLKSEGVQQALYQAFEAVDMSDKDGRRFSEHLEEAMLFNATPAWSAELRSKLKEPIVRPERFDDKPAVRNFNNQRFWQLTAAKVLGRLGDVEGARVLFSVLCDPDKPDIQAEAERAFSGLGVPAVDLGLQLLEGNDPTLSADAQRWNRELRDVHIHLAAKLLTELAHPKSREPVLAAWKQTSNVEAKVALARVLAHLPKSDESFETWKQTYASTRADVTLAGGEGGLETVAHAAVFFFDPELAPWLGARVGQVPGKGARRADVVRALVSSITELMLEEHVKDLTPVSQKYGGREGTPAFEAAAELLKRCHKDPGCFANAVFERGAEGTRVAVKAATMVGVFGNGDHRDLVLQKLGEIRDEAVLDRVAEVVAHLTPSYDEAVVRALEARTKGETSPPALTSLERALNRIRARR